MNRPFEPVYDWGLCCGRVGRCIHYQGSLTPKRNREKCQLASGGGTPCSTATALEMAVEMGGEFFELVLTDVSRHEFDTAPRNLQQGYFAHLLRPQFDSNRAVSDLNHRACRIGLVIVGAHRTWQGSIEVVDGQRHVAGFPDFFSVFVGIHRHSYWFTDTSGARPTTD